MRPPIASRFGKVQVIRRLLTASLVAPAGLSLRLFHIIGTELDDLIEAWGTELQLESLMIKRLTTEARRRPVDEHQQFDDGEHLIEDQIAPAVYERLT